MKELVREPGAAPRNPNTTFVRPSAIDSEQEGTETDGRESTLNPSLSSQPAVDQVGLAKIKQKLEEIENEIEEAKQQVDYGRQESLEREKATILDRVRKDFGLGARVRVLSPEVQKLCARVYNALTRAYKILRKARPDSQSWPTISRPTSAARVGRSCTTQRRCRHGHPRIYAKRN